ncbi:prepilin-type N-terminal cleavage/methylation domain-containing protein [Krasilnikovia cinnamomea]|nr:prepilin-type N-terminal cleavage/methylation domain-containing protein [Krasilnikovia cinnamomea]
MRRLSRALRPRRDDAGITLIEMLIAMGLMSIVMAVATSGMVQVFRVNSATETQAVGQSQLNIATQRLTEQVRYASWVGNAYPVAEARYINFALPQAKVVGGVPSQTVTLYCVRLRVHLDAQPANGRDGRGILQSNKWEQGKPTTTATGWRTLASNIDTAYPTGEPFEFKPRSSTPVFAGSTTTTANADLLRIRLTVRLARAGSKEDMVASTDTTYTAANTITASTETVTNSKKCETENPT